MSDTENRVIRIKVRTADPLVFHGAILMTPDGKQIKEHHALAGDSTEIREYLPDSPVKQFINWKESHLFNEKCDKAATQDFDRLLGRITKNFDFIDRFRQALVDRNVEKTTYDLKMEIQLTLGIKEPEVQLFAQPLAWDFENLPGTTGGSPANDAGTGPNDLASNDFGSNDFGPDGPGPGGPGPGQGDAGDSDARGAISIPGGPDLSQHIALRFIISPSTGTPLGQLQPGAELMVRFADPDEELTCNYMVEQGLRSAPLPEETDEDDGGVPVPGPLPGAGLLPEDGAPPVRNETTAVVTSIESAGKDSLIYVTLPGDRTGYILEDEPSIRVKTTRETAGKPATPAVAAAGSEGRASARESSREGHDFPGLLLIAVVATVLIVILFVLIF